MTTVISGSYPAVNSDSDATVNGLTVGKGGGAISTNTAVGVNAGSANTTGANNVFIGRNAAQSTTASFGTFVGSLAGNATITGDSNTAVGYYSYGSGSSGANNVAIGQQALYLNTTASNNTAVGYQALYTNTTGVENVAIGRGALFGVTTGYENIGIGRGAGESITTGYRNTFVGDDAGYLVTGNNNTIIGRYTGNNGGLDIRTTSNHIVISDGDGAPRIVVNNLGNLRLGGATFSAGTDFIGLDAIGRLMSNCNTDWNQELYGSNTQRIRLFASNGTTTQVGSITVNTTNAAFNTSSDYRLKENIAPMTGALAKVSQLKPCTYTWKMDGSSGEGFIAHELAEVIPQAVSGEKDALDKDGNISPQGIDTSYLVATLTAAIQELKAEFDAYKATHP